MQCNPDPAHIQGNGCPKSLVRGDGPSQPYRHNTAHRQPSLSKNKNKEMGHFYYTNTVELHYLKFDAIFLNTAFESISTFF